jgi:hypothetical protein
VCGRRAKSTSIISVQRDDKNHLLCKLKGKRLPSGAFSGTEPPWLKQYNGDVTLIPGWARLSAAQVNGVKDMLDQEFSDDEVTKFARVDPQTYVSPSGASSSIAPIVSAQAQSGGLLPPPPPALPAGTMPWEGGANVSLESGPDDEW